MILIIDNGGHYSDHSLWFVQCTDEEAKAVDCVLAWRQCALGGYSTPYFVGRAESIDWMHKDFEPMKPAEAIGRIVHWDLECVDDDGEPIPRDVLSACAKHCDGFLKAEAEKLIAKTFERSAT